MSRTVGLGFDSHLFSTKGTLLLGGVRLSGAPALKGHSDGDALLHALIDALLGAAGMGDIGEWFPDTGKENKNKSSVLFLRSVLSRIRKRGFKPVHVDITVLADRPKLSPYKKRIQGLVATELGMPAGGVNVKGKRQEGLSLFKKPGGIAVWAVAVVEKKRSWI